MADERPLCADSAALFQALEACACQVTCAAACADSYCAGLEENDSCIECLYVPPGCLDQKRACVEDRAGSASSSSGGTCATCAEVLADSALAPQLCMAAGTAYQDVQACLCTNACPTECADFCSGAPLGGACQACGTRDCGPLLDTCSNGQ